MTDIVQEQSVLKSVSALVTTALESQYSDWPRVTGPSTGVECQRR